MAKATKLTRLDTRGVAIVDRGANGKRIALAKSASDMTFEEALLDAILKGDMPLDDKAVEDMCMRAGLDAQAIETFKAIMKLAHVYNDNAAFGALLKQQFASGAGAGKPEGAQPMAPGAQQPGAQPGMPGAQQPGAQPMAPGAQPAGAQQPFGGEGEEPEPFGEEDDGAGGDAPFGDEPADEETDEEGKPKGKKPPPFKKAATAHDAEGDDAMTEQEIKQAIAKAATDAAAEVKKAADAQIVELKKQNEELVAVSKAQETAVKAASEAVKKMEDASRLAGWVTKADRELKEIPGETAESLGKQLFDLETANPKIAESTFAVFKKTAETVRQSGLFSPMGFVGQAPIAKAGSAAAEFEKLANELIAKGGSNEPAEIARARAETAIAKAHPALYKRYCDEQEQAAKRS